MPEEKPLEVRERTSNKPNPHMASMPGFEPGVTLVGGECSHHCASLAPKVAMVDPALTARVSMSKNHTEQHILNLVKREWQANKSKASKNAEILIVLLCKFVKLSFINKLWRIHRFHAAM